MLDMQEQAQIRKQSDESVRHIRLHEETGAAELLLCGDFVLLSSLSDYTVGFGALPSGDESDSERNYSAHYRDDSDVPIYCASAGCHVPLDLHPQDEIHHKSILLQIGQIRRLLRHAEPRRRQQAFLPKPIAAYSHQPGLMPIKRGERDKF